AVVLVGDEYNVVLAAFDGKVGFVKRLGVDVTVDRVRKEPAELSGVHVGRRQDVLLRVGSAAQVVVVKGQHIDIGRGQTRFQCLNERAKSSTAASRGGQSPEQARMLVRGATHRCPPFADKSESERFYSPNEPVLDADLTARIAQVGQGS